MDTLLRLQSWFSPAFPTGAYTRSHGLEQAIADGTVVDAETATDWILGVLARGGPWNDAVLISVAMAQAARGDTAALAGSAALAQALSAGRERCEETLALGTAFRRAAALWRELPLDSARRPRADPFTGLDDELALPVVLAVLAAAHALPPEPVIACALQSSGSNLAWIATRLLPLGQSDGLRVVAALERQVPALARRAAAADLGVLGGCALLADIASLRHERLRSRVCVS